MSFRKEIKEAKDVNHRLKMKIIIIYILLIVLFISCVVFL